VENENTKSAKNALFRVFGCFFIFYFMFFEKTRFSLVHTQSRRALRRPKKHHFWKKHKKIKKMKKKCSPTFFFPADGLWV
jgi:hypothetical protein